MYAELNYSLYSILKFDTLSENITSSHEVAY